MAGGEYIGFNNSIFLAEREHSDRNYALGYYLKVNITYVCIVFFTNYFK